MENFILHTLEAKQKTIRFFAAWVALQRIARGTDEMIEEMLTELEVKDRRVEKWTISHCLTNYLSDEPDSDNWKLAWLDTADVVVELDRPVRLKVKETDLLRSYARDKKWNGRGEPHFPIECAVIADFYRDNLIQRARKELDVEAKKVGVPITFRRFSRYPRKLMFMMGPFPKKYFVDGAPFARRVIDLCHGLGGTTTWNERTDREHLE
jgi:hypothetical protein